MECLLCVRHIYSGAILVVPLPLLLPCQGALSLPLMLIPFLKMPMSVPRLPTASASALRSLCVNAELGSGSSGEGSPSPVLAVARHLLGSGRALRCDQGLTESFRKKVSSPLDFIISPLLELKTPHLPLSLSLPFSSNTHARKPLIL